MLRGGEGGGGGMLRGGEGGHGSGRPWCLRGGGGGVEVVC